MITNIKTYMKSLKLKEGDILYEGNPTNVSYPEYKVVITIGKEAPTPQSDKSKYCGVLYVNNKAYGPYQEIATITHNMRIFKIEDIKNEDVKRILKIMLNWYDYVRIDDETKAYYKKVIEIWIKRNPKIEEIIENIEMEKESDKYNI